MPRVAESIGQDPKDRSYYVVIDGVRVASYPFLRSALAHIEAHRDREGNTITFTLDCSPPEACGAIFEEGQVAIETVDQFLSERVVPRDVVVRAESAVNCSCGAPLPLLYRGDFAL